jgi:hypothetical protein
MVPRSYIRKNLAFCAQKHLKAKAKLESIFYAKMAILELCGWIELSFDELVRSCAKKKLSDPKNFKHVESVIIKKTYGFDYDSHFSNMLSRVIGLVEFEKIESKIDPRILAKFKAALATLKQERDREAHSYVKGTTKTLSAPSVILSLFNDVDVGLKEFEIHVKSI